MKKENLQVINDNKDFIRFSIKEMVLNDLKIVLLDPNFSVFFCVFIENEIISRYRIKKPENDEDFINIINSSLTKIQDNINSDDFNILDCKYIDAYKKK